MLRAIDRLKAAANLQPMKKVVLLNDGTEFIFWHRPLTMAQRERAQRNAKSDDAGAFALQLLVDLARDENNVPMFTVGDIADMKHAVRDEDLQKLMLAILVTADDDADQEVQPLDPKSAGKPA